jgi:hypothetical protein
MILLQQQQKSKSVMRQKHFQYVAPAAFAPTYRPMAATATPTCAGGRAGHGLHGPETESSSAQKDM